MYYVYIIYSNLLNEFYCGQTNNIEQRLSRHNSGETKSIKHGIPWALVGYIIKDTRSQAVQLEKQIKKRGIKRWLAANEQKYLSR